MIVQTTSRIHVGIPRKTIIAKHTREPKMQVK
jgi:hypothetical protein